MTNQSFNKIMHAGRTKETVPALLRFLRMALFTLHFSLFISLTACVKDDIYNTDHPNKAKISVTTNWNDRGSGVEKPSSYIISGTTIKEEVTTDKYTPSTLFEAGYHTFYLYNNVTEIPVTGGVAKVNTVTAPRADQNIFIEPFPGWLFTGALTSLLEKDKEYELAATMHQQVRELTLLLKPEGGVEDLIIGMKGHLTGVAGQLTIADKTHSEPSNVALNFTRIWLGADAGKWTTTIRLLGTAGNEQKLSGSVQLHGSIDPIPLESILSTELADFNNNKKAPLTLEAKVIIEPEPSVEVGFKATIKDWEQGTGGTGVAK